MSARLSDGRPLATDEWSGGAAPRLVSLGAAALITTLLALAMLASLSNHVPRPRPAPVMRIVPTTVPGARPAPPPRLPAPALRTPAMVLRPPVVPTPHVVTIPERVPPRPPAPRPVERRSAPPPPAPTAPDTPPASLHAVRVQPPAPPSSAPGVATLEGRIRAAVQAALRYPASSRAMGEQGRALVGFDYRNQAVSGVRLLSSSGIPRLDEAAVETVESASYPPPGASADRTLSLAVWVTFRIDTDAD